MQLTSKKNILLFVGSVLLTGAAIFAAQWKWHFWKTATTATNSPALVNSTDAEAEVFEEAANNETGVKEVLSAHLFGHEDSGKKTTPTEEVPKTQQPLELHGIVYVPQHPERSVALIAETGKGAQNYKIGDEITPLPGWKVFLIANDSVQIEHEGTVELLELPRNFTASTANSQQPNSIPSADGSVMDAMPPEEAPPVEELPPPDNPETPPPEAMPPDSAEVPPPPIETPPADAEAPPVPEPEPPPPGI